MQSRRLVHLSLVRLSAVLLILVGAATVRAQDDEGEGGGAEAASSVSRSDVYVVSADIAPIFADPSTLTKVVTTLRRGRRVVLAGEERNGYYRVQAKGGASAWISAAVVEPERASAGASASVAPRGEAASASKPVASGATVGRKSHRSGSYSTVAAESNGGGEAHESESSSGSSWLGLHAVTFDLGGSFGSINDRNYTEIDLGVNLYFSPYLAWRNAVFGRFMSGFSTLYGLDSSVRGIFSLGNGAAGVTAFAGPGYRFINEGGNTPFAEGGVILKLAGISIGGGVKTLLNTWVRSGVPNDTQYFIILAGGGSL